MFPILCLCYSSAIEHQYYLINQLIKCHIVKSWKKKLVKKTQEAVTCYGKVSRKKCYPVCVRDHVNLRVDLLSFSSLIFVDLKGTKLTELLLGFGKKFVQSSEWLPHIKCLVNVPFCCWFCYSKLENAKKYFNIKLRMSTILSHYPMKHAIPVKFKRASKKPLEKTGEF